MTNKLEILFLSDKQVNELAANNMSEVMHDMERVLSLFDSGDAMCPDKAVMPWGKTIEDENKGQQAYWSPQTIQDTDMAIDMFWNWYFLRDYK
jgi:hypothetical protein